MPVDTGFIVLNDRTHPILNGFFGELGVTIPKKRHAFAYFHEKSGFQYASSNLNGLFARRRNLLDPVYWSMLAEILRFNRIVLRRFKNGRLEAAQKNKFHPIFEKTRLRAGDHLLGMGRVCHRNR